MNPEDERFLEDCDKFKDYANIDEYISDIRRCLVVSGMCKNDAAADRSINAPERAAWIREAFEKHEPASDIAADVGYFCG